MTETVNLYEAKTHLSDLVERAAAGEEIVIAKAGQPKARLMPLAVPKVERVPGRWKGKIWISDDFNDPLPQEIQDAFEGKLP
ncbi:MAG: type II toxin-antitoxin system Phd/YefM family antitoxin [Magnetospirillum sp.]|nr:type II toxin-antitoxin system Phd/YefM family antitoxin [Magnetospirillum sp.]